MTVALALLVYVVVAVLIYGTAVWLDIRGETKDHAAALAVVWPVAAPVLLVGGAAILPIMLLARVYRLAAEGIEVGVASLKAWLKRRREERARRIHERQKDYEHGPYRSRKAR